MHRALIVDFDKTTGIAKCFCRDSPVFLRVKLESNKRDLKGDFIHFKALPTLDVNAFASLQRNDYEIKEAERDDCIWKRDGIIGIRSWIGFSNNPKHLTFHRKTGYTDWYGLVDCSKYQIERSGVFQSLIEINDSTSDSNFTCLFKASSRPVFREKNDTADFVEKMNNYEEKRLVERNSQKNFQDSMDASIMSAIVISISESTNVAVCFATQLGSPILVKFPRGLELNKGQRISFCDYDYQDDTYVPIEKLDSIKVETDQSVRLVNDELFLSAWGALSSAVKPPFDKSDPAFVIGFGEVALSETARAIMERNKAYQVEVTASPAQEGKWKPVLTIVAVGEQIPTQESADFLSSVFVLGEKYQVKKEEIASSEYINENVSSSSESNDPNKVASEVNFANRDNFKTQENREDARSVSKEVKIQQHNGNKPITPSERFSKNISSKRSSYESEIGRQTKNEIFKEKCNLSNGFHAIRTHTNSYKSKFGGMAAKPEVENCVLILKVAEHEVIGYETSQLKLMNIRTEKLDLKFNEWDTLRFIEDYSDNKGTFMKESSIRTSSTDYVSLDSKRQATMKATLIFSSNKVHRSYNKSVAFSNNFGFVELHYDAKYLDEMVLYEAPITLKQCQNSSIPVFTTISHLEKKLGQPEIDNIIKDMEKYEARCFDAKRTDLPSNEFPSRQPFRDNRSNHHGSKRENIAGLYKGLVTSVDFNPRTRRYGEVLTPLGIAVFTSHPKLQSSGANIERGDWITIKLERKIDEYLIKKVDDKMQSVTETLQGKNEHGEYLVDGKIFVKPMDIQHNRYYFFNHYLCDVVVGEKADFEMCREQNVPVTFTYKNSPYVIREERGERGECVKSEYYWLIRAVHGRFDDLPSRREQRPTYSNSSEEKPLKYQPDNNNRDPYDSCGKQGYGETNGHHPGSSQGFKNAYDQQMRNEYRKPVNYEDQNPRRYSPPQQSGSTSNYMNNQHRDMSESSHSMRPRMDIVSRSGNGSPRVNVSEAIVTSRHKNMMIVYLSEPHKAAVIYWKTYDVLIKLGCVFECEYIPIEISDETLRVPFKVTRIIKMDILQRHEVKVEDSACFSLFNLDLSRVLPGYQSYIDRSGRYVIYSENVEPVILGELRDQHNNPVTAEDILMKMRGTIHGKNMVGWCRYVEMLIPKSLVDGYSQEDKEVKTYAWRVVQVVSTKDHYIQTEDEKKYDNMGDKAKEIEHDDEVHRQKIQAQLDFNSRQSNGSGPSSVVSYNPRHRDDESYGGYATPCGPSTIRASTSQSFHSTCVQPYPGSHSSSHFAPNAGRSCYQSNNSDAQVIEALRRQVASSDFELRDARRLLSNMCGLIEKFTDHVEIRPQMKAAHPDDFLQLIDLIEESKRGNDELLKRRQ